MSCGGLGASEKEGKMHQMIVLVVMSQASFLMGVRSLNLIEVKGSETIKAFSFEQYSVSVDLKKMNHLILSL